MSTAHERVLEIGKQLQQIDSPMASNYLMGLFALHWRTAPDTLASQRGASFNSDKEKMNRLKAIHTEQREEEARLLHEHPDLVAQFLEIPSPERFQPRSFPDSPRLTERVLRFSPAAWSAARGILHAASLEHLPKHLFSPAIQQESGNDFEKLLRQNRVPSLLNTHKRIQKENEETHIATVRLADGLSLLDEAPGFRGTLKSLEGSKGNNAGREEEEQQIRQRAQERILGSHLEAVAATLGIAEEEVLSNNPLANEVAVNALLEEAVNANNPYHRDAPAELALQEVAAYRAFVTLTEGGVHSERGVDLGPDKITRDQRQQLGPRLPQGRPSAKVAR